VPAQHLQAAHDLIETSRAALVDPVEVVAFLRAIEAEANSKVVLLEERAPRIVQQRSVGLYLVQDALARLPVLLDVLDRAHEEVKPHEGWLATLPCDVNLIGGLRLQEQPDIGLQHLVGHAEPVAWVKHFLGEEEAVLAIQVACGARGLGQKMQWPKRRRTVLAYGLHSYSHNLPNDRQPDLGCRPECAYCRANAMRTASSGLTR
jgi:hypothetical protein